MAKNYIVHPQHAHTVTSYHRKAKITRPGAIALSDLRPPGVRTVAGSILQQHSFVITSMVILSLPLIQEGQLSVTGERMCTKY